VLSGDVAGADEGGAEFGHGRTGGWGKIKLAVTRTAND